MTTLLALVIFSPAGSSQLGMEILTKALTSTNERGYEEYKCIWVGVEPLEGLHA